MLRGGEGNMGSAERKLRRLFQDTEGRGTHTKKGVEVGKYIPPSN